MNPTSLYLSAYEIMNQSTPLRFDCGKLCGRACCQNRPGDSEDDEYSGMYLFPGEEIVLKEAAFLDIIPVHFEFNHSSDILLATCNGKCDRNQRPLACRIFPLTPYLTKKDILTIRIDPRAIPICPLAEAYDRSKLNLDFIQNVRKACRILTGDPLITDFIAGLSRMFDELNHFLGD